jgi:transposase
MTERRTHDPIPLALTMLIALVGALVALAFSGGQHTNAGAATVHSQAMKLNMNTPSAVALRMDMRRLWEDHVAWTRMAVISLTANLPDTKATVARLLQNQAEIGAAIKPYYGAAAGKKLASLLRQHILIAADLVAVAKKGDQAGVARQQARWSVNADQIAAFLNKANPRFWKLGEMKAMLHEHLGLTTNEVVDRLKHQWTADVRVYDLINSQALQMADMLSNGIIGQFGSRFQS